MECFSSNISYMNKVTQKINFITDLFQEMLRNFNNVPNCTEKGTCEV